MDKEQEPTSHDAGPPAGPAKRLPVRCPACQSPVSVVRLACQACGTLMEGSFDLPSLARLGREDQEFIARFVLASGSLKEMARLMGLSYPTVRNRLNDIIDRCRQAEAGSLLGSQGEE